MPQQIDSYQQNNKAVPAAVESKERAALIVKMKTTQGRTFQQIGDELGISKQRAHEIFHETLRNLPAPDVQDFRLAELERLEYDRSKVQEVIDLGPAHEGYLRAIEVDRRLSESIRKLMGADAPVKAEITGNFHSTYEIVGVDMGEL